MIPIFIPYEQALALKELGFEVECIKCYVLKEETGEINLCGKYFDVVEDFNTDENLTSAPLYQQAFRWFREEYGLYQLVSKGYGWEGKVMNTLKDVGNIMWSDGTFNTYEEAELACLNKLIEIVKG